MYFLASVKTLIKMLFDRGLLILWIPYLVLVLLGGFLISENRFYIKEVVAFGLFTFFFVLLVIALSKTIIKKSLMTFFFVFLTVLLFIKLSFYNYYGVQLNASALYVIFETNTEEAAGFLRAYFGFKNILLLTLCVCLFVIPFFIKKVKVELSFLVRLLSFIGAIGSIVLINWKLKDENLLFKSASVYNEYKQTKELIKNELSQKIAATIKDVTALETQQTYVCIIGESTSSWHMQLYGYHRGTNPLLSKIKSELTIFKDVIAPNVHTILSLDKILTLSNFKEPNKKNNASIVQLANAAGFETYWISNQRPVGFHESVPTMIGTAADETYFTATNDYGDVNYDEKILPVLEKVLKKEPKKKLIFIQLIGTHISYDKRYPPNYSFFKGGNKKSDYNERSEVKKTIDAYDNAVRYNDYIVHSIIEMVSKQKTMSYVSYFSDHGDELFDTMDLQGHNEYHGTKPMYEVPFLVWFSPEYKKQNNRYLFFDSYTNRPYNLEDYFFTFADMSFISFKENDTTRSIFNASFKPRTRMIKNGVDYDAK